MGALKWGLKAALCNLHTTTIVGNRGQLWTSTLSPHLPSPHLDFPEMWMRSCFGRTLRSWVATNVAAAPAQKLFYNFCWPKKFSLSYPFPAYWGRFPGVFQSETQTESSERKKKGWELAVDFWFCGTNPVPSFTGNWHEFCHTFWTFVPKSPRICSGLFSLPQKSTPPSGPKSTPILEKTILGGFSGCSTLVCFAAFGCQYVYADQRRLVS